MSKEEVLCLRNMLLDRRSSILERVRRLAAAWQEIQERDIELEEEAQKASIAKPYDKLDENGRIEIEQIDLALIKMTVGDYGVCESCGDDIAPGRLRAIPWARLCVECARDYEKENRSLPQTSEVVVSGKIPDEYQELTSQQIASLIYERLQADERVDAEELRVSFRKGVVFLDGALESEAEHDIVLRILTDSMGFSSIVDRTGIEELSTEKDEISESVPEADGLDDGPMFYDGDAHQEAFETGGHPPLKEIERALAGSCI